MAKIIKYKFLSGEFDCSTDEKPKTEPLLLEKSMRWNEAAESIARDEACNGEYTIEDDGQPEPEATPEERIAELEEALSLLLSGVTE